MGKPVRPTGLESPESHSEKNKRDAAVQWIPER
jgi:hypothetical protein